MVGGKPGMKDEIQEAGIVPALALVANVKDESFGAGIWRIAEPVGPAFAFPNGQASRPRDRREAERVCKYEVCERDHGRPIAGDGRSCFGHLVIEKGPNRWMSFKAVGLN